MYFQLASSNYSYIVELYNFQLNAVNKTIHTLDKFSYIATFYKLECLSQYLVHFSTYRVTFQTRPCIFSTKLMIFCLHYSDHWSRPGSPPSPSPPSAIEAFVGVGGSLVHCALSASVCLRLLTFQVICNEIFDCLIWSESLIAWSQRQWP